MDIRSTPGRIGSSTQVPYRKRLFEMRQTIRRAVDDDVEDQRYPLDDIDLDWLATLPKTLPRGTLLNVLV